MSQPENGGNDTGLIDVRTDERFDEGQLGAWIAGRLPGTDGPLIVRQFSGGHANLTYLLQFPTHQYVLRRPPLGPVAPTSHDMAREYRVLSRLWKAYPLAPRSYLFCDDNEVLGAPFFLMERREGIVVRREVPEVFGGGSNGEANRRLSEVVIDALASLHSVDPNDAGLGELGHPDGYLTRQAEGWIDRWHRAATEPNHLADEIGAWLIDNLPDQPTVTLLHNDWRLDNMAVDQSDPGKCTAVFDWDMATRGDPLTDLGTLMASWFEAGEVPPGTGLMPSDVDGFMTRSQAMTRYADRTGLNLTSVSWYLAFGCFKMATILQQIFYRWHAGQTEDGRLSDFGVRAAFLMDRAGERRG